MKRYSKEFKEEALKLSDEIGVKKAAQQLGIAYFTLADWRSIRLTPFREGYSFTSGFLTVVANCFGDVRLLPMEWQVRSLPNNYIMRLRVAPRDTRQKSLR